MRIYFTPLISISVLYSMMLAFQSSYLTKKELKKLTFAEEFKKIPMKSIFD